MPITYETEIDGTDRPITDPKLVDIMKVRGSLRYGTKKGNQGKFDNGEILKAVDGNWEVIIRSPSGRETFNFASMVAKEDDDVYVAGNGVTKKFEDSEIIRVRNLSA